MGNVTNLMATSSFVLMCTPKHIDSILTVIYVPKGPAAQLAGYAILATDSQLHLILLFK